MAKKKALKKASQKQAVRASAPAKPSVGAAQVNEAVMKANEAIKAVAGSETEWRLNLLKENEDLARETVDTEVDIRRLLDEHARLKSERAKLSKEQGGLAQSVAELSKQANGAEKENALARAKQADLKDDVDKLDKAISRLTNENDSLEKENKKLSAQASKLDEDVKRLRKLRDEYVKTIARFKEEKDDLLS